MQIASLHVSIPSAGPRLALRSADAVAPVQTVDDGHVSGQQPEPEIEIAGPDREPNDEHAHAHEGGGDELDPAEQAEIAKLQSVDASVRAHERAHQAAGGDLASAATFSYVTGPDGRRYANGGEVSITTSEAASPEQTIARARRVRAAALAPADPSATDLAVAAAAAQMEMRARAELQAAARQEAVAATQSADPATDFGLDVDELELFGGRTALGQDGHVHVASGCAFCNNAVAAFNVNV